MASKTAMLAFAVSLSAVGWGQRVVRADLIIPELNKKVLVDFSSFTGAGLSPSPAAGQLDSTTWRVGGFTDGTLNYGDTGVTGDFARGKSSGGVTSGGLYAFEVAKDDWALGVQPTGTDFNPGLVEVRIRNSTGSAVSGWKVDYDAYYRNDQGRSSSWNFSYSTDGLSFTDVPEMDFASPAQADSTSFAKASRSATISSDVPNDGRLFFRWTSADVGGTGSRDELALDNLTLGGIGTTATPEPSTLVLTGVATLAAWGYRRRRQRTRRQTGEP
jgi:uncharacterized protein